METYRPLIKNGNNVGEPIKSCSNMLANGCQCRKAASFVVQKGVPILDEGGEETPEEMQVDTPFQVCARCKVLLEAGYAVAPIMGVGNTGTVEQQMTYPVSQTDVVQEEEKDNEKSIENDNSTTTVKPGK